MSTTQRMTKFMLYITVFVACLLGYLGTARAERGIWTSAAELSDLPMAGPAWEALLAQANADPGQADIADYNQKHNVNVLAIALVYARTGDESSRERAIVEILEAIGTELAGETLALGRNLLAYIIAADLVGLPPDQDAMFRTWLDGVRTEVLAKRTLISTHEDRPNNWGTQAGASRIAAALYLGDTLDLEAAAQVFKGWLGDRSAYVGFRWGSDTSWHCDENAPVGINPKDCVKDGYAIDGVLPDDQRRAGSLTWPPPKENYVYGALQGAIVQAVLLHRAGYDALDWEDQAILRAFQWLHTEADFPAKGDDTWQPWVINSYYSTQFPTLNPARPGKNMGWTDWTHQIVDTSHAP